MIGCTVVASTRKSSTAATGSANSPPPISAKPIATTPNVGCPMPALAAGNRPHRRPSRAVFEAASARTDRNGRPRSAPILRIKTRPSPPSQCASADSCSPARSMTRSLSDKILSACRAAVVKQSASARSKDRSTMPQTVLVTGASSGIGAATARLFHARGFTVFGTTRAANPVSPARIHDALARRHIRHLGPGWH